MKHLLLLVLTVAGVAALEGLFFGSRFLRERRQQELKRRLQALGSRERGGFELLRRGRLSSIPLLHDLLRSLPAADRLERLLEQADTRMTVAGLLAASLGTAFGGVALALLRRAGPGMVALLAALGAAIPFLLVLVARDKRGRKISEQLPEALEMMARSLRAGHALTSSFKLVASEMPEPVSVEFGRAFEEQNLGLPFEQAVLHMTGRAPGNRDLKIFAVSVIVQKETGGNLVEILEKIAETIRARYRFYGKLAALTAEGKVSAIILGFLPLAMALVMQLTNPGYFIKLFDDPMGQNILAYAVTSWIVGVVLLRQMSKVEL